MTGTPPPANETTRTQDPLPASDHADTTDPPLAAKWPWWMSALLAAVALTVLVYFVIRGWDYVVHHDESAERADYEQLLGLIDRIQTVAMFVLGSILGVSIAAGGAANAATAALRNKAEANKQNEVARHNQHAADTNRGLADAMKTDLARTADLLASIQDHAALRQQDGSRWVSEHDVQRATRDGDDYLRDPHGDQEMAAGPQLAPIDPVLETLSAQAARLAADISRWQD